LAELKRDAMLAVAGTIEGVVRVVQDETRPWPARVTSVHTEYVLHVDQVVWDPHEVAPGDRLLFCHPGGVADTNHAIELAGIPPFAVGEAVLLFLQRRPFWDDDHFASLGGGHPAGRFPLRDGMAYPGETGLLDAPLGLDEFITRIRRA
jgi:hypothetical protein